MAIKDPLMFITIEEFKNWKGFNKSLFDEVTTPDSEIRYAIEIASSNIDFLSGFTISKKWPEINPTKFTDNIQTATTHYVNFLLGKGVEYARGQASIGQGGITYSQNNPEDPYYIVPQVFNYLKEINEYPIMQGFNLNVSSKQNWFKKFMGNGGEQNPWEIYVQFTNIKSSDDRTKITITHPKNIMGSVVDIDTRGIKSFDNLTTLELFTKYFSNDTMKLVDGKEGQEKKVISATGGNSLWEINIDNPNFIKSKDDKGISANDKRIIDVGTPTFLTDATNKVYVDDLLDKKQDKIDNLQDKIFNNKDDKDSTRRLVNEIIKTNVGGKTLIYRNNPVITDDLDIPNKKYIDDKIDKKQDKENWVVIGKKVDNRTWDNFNIDLNKTYRVFITWHRNAPEQNGYPLMLLFKSAKAVGTGTWTLLIGKIDNKDASLILKADYTKSTNKWSLFIKCEIDGGAIFSFEELKENTYQITSNTLNITSPSVINIDKPIKINSKSLETNEIEENNWDIELKNNPPTPSPTIPQWKEVGTREKNKLDNWQITYDFQENKHYRIYYSWSIYNPVYTIQEFIITNKKIAGVQIQTFNDSANIVILSVQHAKLITIYTGKGNLKGNVWKLEELQE
ncbi:hypothetical protein [Spiroplasma endosymbiont of Dasysyrphus albostriatus]|uniref:hypothetical protein n=1 Tax=Spiroplasma endosymbiont of Dasysyrphus albostriatus TaxID=3066299 RepID=UPI0030CC4733